MFMHLHRLRKNGSKGTAIRFEGRQPCCGMTQTAQKGSPISRSNIVALALLLAGFGVAQKGFCDTGVLDVTQIPIEQLVRTDFIPASRIARQISDAEHWMT